MKLKLLLFIFSFCFLSNLFAFTVEDITVDKKIPYRIYIGEDKKVDWIDIIGKYDLENNKFIFEDRSPIRIIEVDRYNVVLIKKDKSLWKLYWSSFPLDNRLILLDPYIPEKITSIERKVIYKN